MISNYAFFSGWIANLGVVPLFSFACFLLAPDFFNLFFLLARVCVVFEDIFHSLSYLININYRGIFLSRIPSLVKIFLPLMLLSKPAFAEKKDVFLSKGEQIEISIGKLDHFSVGNKEVIKYKYLPKKNKILILGKSLGFSDLVAWKKDNTKQTYNFYITSKKEQLKKMEIAQVLKNTKLKTKIAGGIVYVNGILESLDSYLLFKNLEKMKLKNLILNVSIHKKLKNRIIGKIYNNLYQQGFEYIYCQELNAQISCEFNTQTNPKLALFKFINTYNVNFINLNSLKNNKNFKLHFKIISIENDQINLRNPGINNIDGELQSLITNNQFTNKTHNIFIEDQKLEAKLIASPEVTTIIDQKFKIELGGEVPIPSTKNEQEVVTWKFIGLRINGLLSLKRDRFLLKYKSLLTKNSEGSISGPRGESGLYIPEGKFIKLYSIKVQNKSSKETGIPLLNKIPFLKNLFISKNSNSSQKRIVIFVKIMEISYE